MRLNNCFKNTTLVIIIIPYSARDLMKLLAKLIKAPHIYSLKATFVVVGALALICAVSTSPAQAKGNDRYASIIIDSDTGVVLHERYADKSLHPASLTKAMTLLMVFEAIENNEIDLNTRIKMTSHAASMVPSKIGLKPGETIKVKDAIYALVTKSANDVAAAVGDHIGGTEANFARMMTRKARDMGMRNTTFRNASGLHDPKQITTARDMALMAQYIINVYPEYYRYFSAKNFTYQGQTYRNHNRLMNTYKGMDGMKTGYIAASGFNLVASAVRNNRRLIGVVFGGRSAQTRNDHMASLLDKGFGKVNEIRVAAAKVPLPPRKPGILTAMAALRDNDGQSSGANKPESSDARLAAMGQLIGEGDYDLDKIRRIETGMLAMAAHTGREISPPPHLIKASLKTQPDAPLTRSRHENKEWAIQVGAFTSRAKTDQMLISSLQALPDYYSKANPVIAPLKTQDGWLFRGRLVGFTRPQAMAACSYFEECMPIAPNNK